MSKKSQHYNRTESLKIKFNGFMSSVTKQESNYYDSLGNEELLQLKYALSDINNIITLKITYSLADWLVSFFELTDSIKNQIIEKVESEKPNSNGYDIDIKQSDLEILAEVKSTIPINNGNYFGIAQINGILDDAIKLYEGKKGKINQTQKAYKIIGIIDIGEQTDKALVKVLAERKLKKEHTQRENKNKIKEKLEIITENMSWKDLSLDKVYIKKIRFDRN